MEFNIVAGNFDGAKAGQLSFKNIVQPTPFFIVNTRCGLVAHLTPDVLETSNLLDCLPAMCGVPLSTIIEQPGVDVIRKFKGSFQEFCGMKGFLMMCCLKSGADQVTDGYKYNEESSVSIWTSSGRKKINPLKFMDVVNAFQFSLVQSMADVIPKGQTSKRCKKSVDRTLKFLDTCLELRAKQEKGCNPYLGVFGVVTGGDNEQERIRSAKETCQRNIQGLVFAGFDRLHEDALPLLKTSIQATRKMNKPMMLTGVFKPDDIIQAVRSGIDIFDTSCVDDASERGCALSFKYTVKKTCPDQLSEDVHEDHSTGNSSQKSNTNADFKIDLNEDRYANDFTSLVVGCKCHTCQHHTKAYIRHLLVTKEMLAPVLLMIHNLFHFSGFFVELRTAVQSGTLDDFEALVCGRQR